MERSMFKRHETNAQSTAQRDALMTRYAGTSQRPTREEKAGMTCDDRVSLGFDLHYCEINHSADFRIIIHHTDDE